MTKKAYDKIADGLTEALSIERGETQKGAAMVTDDLAVDRQNLPTEEEIAQTIEAKLAKERFTIRIMDSGTLVASYAGYDLSHASKLAARAVLNLLRRKS